MAFFGLINFGKFERPDSVLLAERSALAAETHYQAVLSMAFNSANKPPFIERPLQAPESQVR